MKFDIPTEDITILTPKEVAEQLAEGGYFDMNGAESITAARLEFGTDLEIDIHDDDAEEDRTETMYLSDIREAFNAADAYLWARDENGNDVLLCIGC